jgi:deoxyhypusine synthase
MKSELGVETNKAVRTTKAPVSAFIRHHFRHFNAAALIDAADAYRHHVDGGAR